jgi:carbamoylphosphate synthase large subunit
MQAFLVERKFEGVTLTIRPTNLDRNLCEKCIAFTDEFGLTGSYHFEFLFDPGTRDTYFLEVNSRLGGTTAKAYACGYDEPLFALQAYGVRCNNQTQLTYTTVSSKQALLKYMYYTLMNRLTLLDYPLESKLARMMRALWGLFVYRDDVFNVRDIPGSLTLYAANLKGKIRRMMPP